MAKDTVEILGGQLDGAVLQNAASEATLKELVAAISGKGSSGSSGGMLGRTPAGMIAGGVVNVVSGAVKGAVNQIGNVTGAAGAFAGMMFKGEGRLSSYTKVLNNQVISQLPVFGRYLGAVGGAISGTIEEFERWNTTLRSLTNTGATFNNSIIQMMYASARTYMSLDEFASFVQKNNKTFVALGATVTQGSQAFSDYAYEILKASGPARKTLIQMGYTVPQINQGLADFLENNYRGIYQDRVNQKNMSESFVVYQTYLHTLSSLTGKQADQLRSEMETVQHDTAYKLRLNDLDAEQRKKVNLALANYTALYGKQGAEIFKALFLGLNPASDAAATFAMMFPNTIQEMKNTINTARNGNESLEGFRKLTVKERARLIKHSAAQIERFRPLLEAGSIGIAEFEHMTGVSKDIAAYIARTGKDVSKMSLEELEAMQEEADAETKKREELTEILRSFETAMGDFKTGFLDVMTKPDGPLMQFANAMKGKELPDKIRKFGRDFGYFVTDTIPLITKFFAKMATEEGRAEYMLYIKKAVMKMGAYMLAYLPKLLGRDVNEEELQKQLTRIDNTYNPQIATQSEGADMAATRLTRKAFQVGGPELAYGQAAAGKGGKVYQDQAGAIRNKPISNELLGILAKAARDAGVDLRVTSGGQMSMAEYNAAKGKKEYDPNTDEYKLDGRVVRTGKKRHDDGHAADLDVYAADSNTPLHIGHPSYMAFLKAAKASGITNVGAGEGYMNTGGSGTRIHMGIRGPAAKWGGDDGPYAELGMAGFRNGLQEYGTLFSQFGGNVELHDKETVQTAAQFTNQMVTAAQTSGDGIADLNRNLGMLIGLMNEKNKLTGRISEKMAMGSRDLISSFS